MTDESPSSQQDFFRRLKRRSVWIFSLFMLAVMLQFAMASYISWRHGQMLKLTGLLNVQKSELSVVGRSLQEVVMLQNNGPTFSRLLESNKRIIREKTAEIRERDTDIDQLIWNMRQDSGDITNIENIRGRYATVARLFLERADDISSDSYFVTKDFLTLTDLIVSPNGVMMTSFEDIDNSLLQYGLYLQKLGLFGHAVIGLFMIAFSFTLIFVLFWRLVDRASADYLKLMNSLNVRTRYFYQMSHELRTPLNAILGYAEFLSLMLKDATQKTYAEHIQQAGVKLYGHIDNIIVLSQLNSNSYEVRQRDCNLFGIIRPALKNIGHNGRKIDLDISPVPEDGLVYCDPEAFAKIFQEILMNAVTHASTSVHIRITGQPGCKTVEISDDGPGISDADIDRICQPFQTASNSYGTTDNGPGIGLTVARMLGGLNGIVIEFIQNQPQGLTVRLSVPDFEPENQHAPVFNELLPQFLQQQR